MTRDQEAVERRERARRIHAEVERLTPLLVGLEGVEKVVLFGSAATGRTGIASDIDLLVVRQTTERFLDRLASLLDVLEPQVATDLLVFTPQELAENADRPFLRRILAEGKVLYEA